MWVTLPSPELVEMLGSHGVDACIIDLEHTTFGLEMVERMTVAAELAGVTPLVRVPAIARDVVTRVLDSGVQGILFPLVSSGEDAEEAAMALRFPPVGTRGWGGRHVRRARWSGPPQPYSTRDVTDAALEMHSPAYLTAVDATVASIFMIESPRGVENVDGILDRGSPDALIFGLADYAVAVGFDVASVDAAARHVYAACRSRGVGIGALPGSPGAEDLAPGDFCVAGVDSLLVNEALGQRVAATRKAIASLAARPE